MSGAHILVVDDEAMNRELLTALLEPEDYAVTALESGQAALDFLATMTPDLILTDVMMPGIDGIELCRRVKADPATRLVPVVLITALSRLEDRVRGIEAGADDFLSKPVHLHELLARVRSLLRMKRYLDQLDHAETVLYSLALGVEAKDPLLEGHCDRLARYAVAIGTALELDAETLEALRRGGVLHDLGKIGIPDAILFKPGALTPDEWGVMREHPAIGERICQPLKSMQRVLPIIRHHHERWNGTGYPDGLAGPAIPLSARILQVADVFDALSTSRPYRVGLPPAEAIRVLREETDRGFWDGSLVELFAALWAPGTLAPTPQLLPPSAAGAPPRGDGTSESAIPDGLPADTGPHAWPGPPPRGPRPQRRKTT